MEILEPLYNEPCIYCILNYDNGKMYFGLTKHFKTRVRDHFNDLKALRHNNFYLQNAWNKQQKFVIFPVEKSEDEGDDKGDRRVRSMSRAMGAQGAHTSHSHDHELSY